MDEARVAVFWSRVERRGDDECWPWKAHRNPKGYGLFWFEGHGHTSPRVAWWISTGAHPGDLHVLHRCDNPPCCNPAHLFLGTNAENMQDSFAKGRKNYRGEGCPRARLKEVDVLAIRQRYANGEYGMDLAAEFAVTPVTVSAICSGRIWPHVGGPRTKRQRGPRPRA